MVSCLEVVRLGVGLGRRWGEDQMDLMSNEQEDKEVKCAWGDWVTRCQVGVGPTNQHVTQGVLGACLHCMLFDAALEPV